ncbi:MAG: transcription repressor NadR [Ruminococcus sp.]|nr:transcription repressor NadR [Ruminococcus sp.]
MKAQERRKTIINILLSEDRPIPGGELSEKCGVSRQIIVQDIAVLKGQGFDILSTHNGYLVQKSPFKDRVFKVKHSTDQTEDELSTIVELGGTVVDVFVWHKVYGKMSAPLNIFSELQIKQFIEGIRAGKSTELMNITGGYHYHTIRAEKEETLDLIAEVLSKKGYVAPEI